MNPIESIRSVYDKLSKTQQRIADFLLRREDTACFMSLNELSEAANVTPVTVMRFVKSLGYENYSDFKKEYQGYIQTMISPRNVVRKSTSESIAANSEIIEQIRQNEKRLLDESYQMISDDHLLNAVSLIKQAKKIYLVAKNLSEPIANIFQKRLTFLGLNSEILNLDNINLLPRTLANADGLDVFVVFTFPNYSPIIGYVAKCARQRGSRIICITDKTTSPPACYSDIILLCHTASVVFYNSMTAPMSIVNILATLLAIELKEKLEANKETYKLLASFLENDDPAACHNQF